jgi:hypothetical protein
MKACVKIRQIAPTSCKPSILMTAVSKVFDSILFISKEKMISIEMTTSSKLTKEKIKEIIRIPISSSWILSRVWLYTIMG